jgi:hypothetical protein
VRRAAEERRRRDRASALEDVKQSVPTAAALIAPIAKTKSRLSEGCWRARFPMKRGQEFKIGSTIGTSRRRVGPKDFFSEYRVRCINICVTLLYWQFQRGDSKLGKVLQREKVLLNNWNEQELSAREPLSLQ